MTKFDKTILLSSGDPTIKQFIDMTPELERQELDAPEGIASPQVYGQLLAVYLLQNDLPNAKYLWKRIPSNIKEENPEIVKLWAVGQKLWQCISSVYGSLNEEWPDYLKPVINLIADTTRRRAFSLVSNAYSSISIEGVSAFLGLPEEDCVEVLSSIGWEVDNTCKMINPKNNENKPEETVVSEEHLSKLTDFVAFLEN